MLIPNSCSSLLIFENLYVLITLRNLLFAILPELFARIWSTANFWGGQLPPCSPARMPMYMFAKMKDTSAKNYFVGGKGRGVLCEPDFELVEMSSDTNANRRSKSFRKRRS